MAQVLLLEGPTQAAPPAGALSVYAKTDDRLYILNSAGVESVLGTSTGTVTALSVASVNGFAGSFVNPTTTPSLNLTTTVTGMVKGAGNALLAATAGTDYSAGTSALATGILKSTTTTGALTIATGADLPVMTSTVGGAVPTPPNNQTTFLRGDGVFATPGINAPDIYAFAAAHG